MKRNDFKLIHFAAIVMLFLAACSPTKNLQDDLSRQIIGEWRNVYVKIKVRTAEGKWNITEADSTNWEEKLGIKPIRTFFRKDGTYYSEYHDLKDSITRSPAGLWSLKVDTITLTQNKPNGSITKMRLQIEKDKATFSGRIDFEGKGQADDEYFGIQRRYSH